MKPFLLEGSYRNYFNVTEMRQQLKRLAKTARRIDAIKRYDAKEPKRILIECNVMNSKNLNVFGV